MKPILFNTEMVRAILDGRKTATRRCIKFLKEKNPSWTGYVKDSLMLYNGNNEPCCQKTPYQVGDVLYVRETWTKWTDIWNCEKTSPEFFYKADTEKEFMRKVKWRPSIHMPKEAARIFLKVTDVRVERLQDMTVDDVHHEGVSIMRGFEDFKKLWNSTIKKENLHIYGWKANPYVWVIEFERCEKPESEGI